MLDLSIYERERHAKARCLISIEDTLLSLL